MGANIGYATLSVIPSFKGMEPRLRAGIGKTFGGVRSDATAAGTKTGNAFTSGMSGAFGKLGPIAVLGTAAAGAAVVGLGIKGVMAFTDFQRSMNEVFTLMPGISEQAMGDMSDQVKSFSTEFGVLPDQVVPALYQALSAGVPPGNVFDFLETAQKAAKGGVTELTTAVDGISSVTNAYGADVVSATQASDLMFTAVKLGKTTFDELSSSLFNVTPTTAALGVQFGDVTAALAAMTAQGIPTTVATTQLRQLFVEMSKEGSKTAGVFEGIAGKSFKQFVAEGGNTQQALQLLEQAAADSGVGINDLFGSVEAGSAALALTGGGTDKFSEALAGMAGSAGATDAAFDQMDKGLGPIIDKFKAWAQVGLIEIGERLAPILETIGAKILEIFDAVGPLADAFAAAFNGEAISDDGILGQVSRFGATVRDLFDWVSTTASTAWENLSSAVSDAVDGILTKWDEVYPKLEPVLTWLGDVFTNVIIPAVKAWYEFLYTKVYPFLVRVFGTAIEIVIEVLGFIAVAITDYVVPAFEWLAEKGSEVWEKVRPAFEAMGDWIVGTLVPFLQRLWNTAQTVWAGIAQAVQWAWASVIQPAWDLFQTYISTILVPVLQTIWAHAQAVWSGIAQAVSFAWSSVIQPIWAALSGFVSGVIIPVFTFLWNTAQTVWAGIQAVISIAWGIAQPIFAAIANFVTGVIVPAFNTGLGVAQSVWSGISSAISAAWGGIQAVFGFIAGGIETIKGAFQTIADTVHAVFDNLAAPIRAAFDGIKSAWNSTVGGKGISIPGFSIPGTDVGFGGLDFTIPSLHTGGIVPGRPGEEILALLEAGEQVIARDEVRPPAATPARGGRPLAVQLVLPDGRLLAEVTRPELRVLDETTRGTR